LGRGYLANREKQREQEMYNQSLDRKAQQLRMASDMRMQEEDKRATAEQTRKQNLINQKIEEVKTMFPDRWENEPGFQQKVTAGLNGIVLPNAPVDPEIGNMFAQGKTQEAFARARQSTNPADLEFFKSLAGMQELLNPRKTISSGGYLHTYSQNDPLGTLQSKQLPFRDSRTGGGGARGSQPDIVANRQLNQALKLKEKEIKDAEESIKRGQEDIDSGASENTQLIESEKRRLQKLKTDYRNMLQTGTVQKPAGKQGSNAYQQLGTLFGKYAEFLKKK